MRAVIAATRDRILAAADRGQGNLVGNAAKFSNPGSPIGLQALPSAGGAVVVEVRDRGWGITAEDLSRIFQKYRRGGVPDGEQRPNGIGVGLYLCQRIIEAHGSTIAVQSQPGRGSSFSFQLEPAT